MKLIHFILGLIYFQASGGFSERFINLCKLNKVRLYNISEENGVLYGATNIRGFKKIRLCAKKSGMRIKVISKKGLPFLYAGISARNGLLLGAVAMCFLLFFYSRCIWRIDVTGNEKIKSEKVISVLEENNVRLGTMKKDLDNNALKLRLYEEIPEIAWVNFKTDGSRLVVDLREVTKKPETEAKNYCNIVAETDGIIKKIVLYDGSPLLKEGDAVREGQIIVSGIKTYENAKLNTFHHAKAEVYALTKKSKTIKIAKRRKISEYTGREKRLRTLKIFRLKIPLYVFTSHFKSEEKSEIEKPLIINGVRLPVSIFESELKETEEKIINTDVSSASMLVRSKEREYRNGFKPGTKIIKCTKKISTNDSFYFFKYNYLLYEDIAKTSNIEIEK